MKSLSLLICCASLILISPKSYGFGEDSRSAAVDEMLDSFAQGCQMGPWTHSALRRARTLTSLLESLREKSTCSGMENSIAASQGLQSEISKMLENGDFANEKVWEEVVNDLSVAMNDPSLPPDVRSSMASDYSYARFELTKARAKVNVGLGSDGRMQAARGMENIRNYLGALISDIDGISKCYADNPSAGMQIGTQILGLAGSFAPGLIGLGIQTLAKLFETGIVFARTMPISRSMYEAKKARMPVALTCGMEAFTRDFCRAQDALELSNLERWPDGKMDNFFYGVDLMERRLPVLYGWLDKVVNGVQPVDTDHASKIDEQFRRVNNTNSMRRVAEGAFNEAREKLNRGNARERTLRSLLRALVQGIFYVDHGNGKLSPRRNSPFVESANAFIYSITLIDVPKTNEPTLGYIDRINLVNTQLDDINKNLFGPGGVFTDRYDEVVREFNAIVSVDNSTLVRSVSSRSLTMASPLGAFYRTSHFLRRYSYHENPDRAAQEKLLIDDVDKRIDAVTVLLDAPNATDDWTVDPVLKLTPAQNAIQSVYNEFRLENNNVFLPNRMSRLVKDDLTNRICKDEAPEEIEKVLYQAGSDIFDILARANLTAYQVKKDVSAAQYISAASLAEYRKFFATNIGWAIKDLHEAAEKNKEPKDGTGYAPYRETLAHLCIMTLISGMEWPEKKDSWGSDNKDSREYCRGTQIESKEAKLVLKFSELEQNLKNRTLNQRICVYDDFVRSDRLAFRLQRKSGELQCRPEDHRILSSQPSKPASYWQRYVDHLQGS